MIVEPGTRGVIRLRTEAHSDDVAKTFDCESSKEASESVVQTQFLMDSLDTSGPKDAGNHLNMLIHSMAKECGVSEDDVNDAFKKLLTEQEVRRICQKGPSLFKTLIKFCKPARSNFGFSLIYGVIDSLQRSPA